MAGLTGARLPLMASPCPSPTPGSDHCSHWLLLPLQPTCRQPAPTGGSSSRGPGPEAHAPCPSGLRGTRLGRPGLSWPLSWVLTSSPERGLVLAQPPELRALPWPRRTEGRPPFFLSGSCPGSCGWVALRSQRGPASPLEPLLLGPGSLAPRTSSWGEARPVGVSWSPCAQATCPVSSEGERKQQRRTPGFRPFPLGLAAALLRRGAGRRPAGLLAEGAERFTRRGRGSPLRSGAEGVTGRCAALRSFL